MAGKVLDQMKLNPTTQTLQPDPRASETAWRDPWEATKEVRLMMVGREITDEINQDPKEIARLRQSLKHARQGKTMPWRDASDDT